MEPDNAFELVSLIMRYVFAALGAFIVLKAFFALRRDASVWRKTLRRLPDAGMVGELREENGRLSVQLPREGVLGKAPGCDVRLRGKGIAWKHAFLLFSPGKGIRITPCFGKKLVSDGINVKNSAMLLHGSELEIGPYRFRVLFFAGVDAPHYTRIASAAEEDAEYFPGTEQSAEAGLVFDPAGRPAYPEEPVFTREGQPFYGNGGMNPSDPDTIPEEWGNGGLPDGWGENK